MRRPKKQPSNILKRTGKPSEAFFRLVDSQEGRWASIVARWKKM